MIGPAIPEALLKKKQVNESEIVVTFSDDEEEVAVAGPQIPQHILNQRSIGPQIPQHFQANTDEIPISDDEEDTTVGPQIPQHILNKMNSVEQDTVVGPQIPQHILNKKNSTEQDITVGPQIPQHILNKMNSVEQDTVGPQIPQHILNKRNASPPVEEVINPEDFAPALPPDLLEQRQKQPPAAATGRRRRPVGPTFPTGPIPRQEEDEYMVGPALPKDYNPEVEAKYSAIHAIEERAREAREAMEKKEADKGKVQRPDWMLVPPEVDYLKKANSSKSRQFTNKTMSKEELDSAEWTMTPAQKQQRLEDERSGKRKMKDEEINFSELDMERIRNIQEYNMQTRPLTLLELHQQKKKRSKEPTSDIEDVTKRAFDREKDLLGTRKMDRKSKKEMLKQSAQFGQKFGYGSSSFL